MRRIGFRWVDGISSATYPDSILLAGVYLWAWGYTWIAVGFGATRFMNGWP